MPNNGFDRTILNVRERPLSSDINQAQSQLDRTTRELLKTILSPRVSAVSDLTGNPISGCMGDGLKVRQSAVPGLSVKVTLGQGFMYAPGDVPSSIGGVVGLDDLSAYKPLPLLADATISGIPAGPGGINTRTDIVEVRVARRSTNSLSRDTLDVPTGLFVPGLVNKTLDFTLDGDVGLVSAPAASTAAISYKVGIVNGGAPAVTPGYMKIASVVMDGTVATVTKGKIIDERAILFPYSVIPFSLTVSLPFGAASPPSIVALQAPPGIEFVVTKVAPPGQFQFLIWCFAGGAGPTGSMTGNVRPVSFSASQFFALQNLGPGYGVLSAVNVAQIADATVSGPATAMAVGQPYIAVDFFATRQAGGVTDTTSIPDPMIVDIQGMIQRG